MTALNQAGAACTHAHGTTEPTLRHCGVICLMGGGIRDRVDKFVAGER